MGNAIAYFTPAAGIAGGLIIGLGAAVLLLLTGDILGASGIVNTLFLSPREAVTEPGHAWKLVFLSTFGLLSSLVLGRQQFAQDDRLGQDDSIPVVSTAGYLIAGGTYDSLAPTYSLHTQFGTVSRCSRFLVLFTDVRFLQLLLALEYGWGTAAPLDTESVAWLGCPCDPLPP